MTFDMSIDLVNRTVRSPEMTGNGPTTFIESMTPIMVRTIMVMRTTEEIARFQVSDLGVRALEVVAVPGRRPEVLVVDPPVYFPVGVQIDIISGIGVCSINDPEADQEMVRGIGEVVPVWEPVGGQIVTDLAEGKYATLVGPLTIESFNVIATESFFEAKIYQDGLRGSAPVLCWASMRGLNARSWRGEGDGMIRLAAGERAYISVVAGRGRAFVNRKIGYGDIDVAFVPPDPERRFTAKDVKLVIGGVEIKSVGDLNFDPITGDAVLTTGRPPAPSPLVDEDTASGLQLSRFRKLDKPPVPCRCGVTSETSSGLCWSCWRADMRAEAAAGLPTHAPRVGAKSDPMAKPAAMVREERAAVELRVAKARMPTAFGKVISAMDQAASAFSEAGAKASRAVRWFGGDAGAAPGEALFFIPSSKDRTSAPVKAVLDYIQQMRESVPVIEEEDIQEVKDFAPPKMSIKSETFNFTVGAAGGSGVVGGPDGQYGGVMVSSVMGGAGGGGQAQIDPDPLNDIVIDGFPTITLRRQPVIPGPAGPETETATPLGPRSKPDDMITVNIRVGQVQPLPEDEPWIAVGLPTPGSIRDRLIDLRGRRADREAVDLLDRIESDWDRLRNMYLADTVRFERSRNDLVILGDAIASFRYQFPPRFT